MGLLKMDWPTALFVFVVFLLVMFCLNTLLFKPLLKTLGNREKHLEENQKKAENADRSIGSLQSSYEQQLAEARSHVQGLHKEKTGEANREAENAIGSARSEVQALVGKNQKEIAEHLVQSKKDSVALSQELAKLIAEKALA